MKKLLRRWSKRFKNQRKKNFLLTALNFNFEELVSNIEELLIETIGIKTYTKFQDLGGVNNHGMMLHFSQGSDELVAVTKIEEYELADREHRFLDWQKEYHGNNLAASPIAVFPIENTGFSCFISSPLEHQNSFSYEKAEQLFILMGRNKSRLNYLSKDGNKDNLPREIEPTTKIKSMLANVVSRFDSEETKVFIKDFLDARKVYFETTDIKFNEVCSVLDDAYRSICFLDLALYSGLVHGDFKKQNILNFEGDYRLIDLQYYTFGLRLWDLAFLYSKDDAGFQAVLNRIDCLPSEDEKKIVVYLYVLASLINIKKKRSKKVILNNVASAVEYLAKY